MDKRTLEPNERYLVIEALKRWKNDTQMEIARLNAINGSYSYKESLKKELAKILALIAKFGEGAL